MITGTIVGHGEVEDFKAIGEDHGGVEAEEVETEIEMTIAAFPEIPFSITGLTFQTQIGSSPTKK